MLVGMLRPVVAHAVAYGPAAYICDPGLTRSRPPPAVPAGRHFHVRYQGVACRRRAARCSLANGRHCGDDVPIQSNPNAAAFGPAGWGNHWHTHGPYRIGPAPAGLASRGPSLACGDDLHLHLSSSAAVPRPHRPERTCVACRWQGPGMFWLHAFNLTK